MAAGLRRTAEKEREGAGVAIAPKYVETRPEAAASPGPTPERLPKHVAIIMDGNGRWAQRRGFPRIAGHRQGAHTVRRIVEECSRLRLGALTLYCLSSENWKRPQRELDQLMGLLRRYLVGERPTMMKNNVRLRFVGRREGLPPDVLAELDRSLEETSRNTGLVLGLAINYGARGELADAARALAERVAQGKLDPAAIDEDALASQLYTAGMPDPDLLIRTAGELRVSNFLLWQISYAEIWVTEACWPEFGVEHLHRALADFANRERRYGGLKE
ncbi:MAG TPA: isoprenyl transferase [Planctomycetia bacterium]|nr:isoprenyl transferase [Planctomycetia bacterium]